MDDEKQIKTATTAYRNYLRWAVQLRKMKANKSGAAEIADAARMVKAWRIRYEDEEVKLFDRGEE